MRYLELDGTPVDHRATRLVPLTYGHFTAAPPGPAGRVVAQDPDDTEPAAAMRTCSQVYERELPHIKHLATMGLTRAYREAVAGGFDNAVFVDRDGLVLEGSIWNIAFWDGEAVVWPQADDVGFPGDPALTDVLAAAEATFSWEPL